MATTERPGDDRRAFIIERALRDSRNLFVRVLILAFLLVIIFATVGLNPVASGVIGGVAVAALAFTTIFKEKDVLRRELADQRENPPSPDTS
jgi:small neutral amino acid transporter SnatA (MarC family)